MMHDGQLSLDEALVARLVAAQFPELSCLPVREVRSTGTVNGIYRIGDGLYARLPLLARWAADLERESRLVAELAPYLSLRVPEQVAAGVPGEGYPCEWGIFRWIEGEAYSDEAVEDERAAAAELATFVRELRAIPLRLDAPRAGRKPLRTLDDGTRRMIKESAGDIDADAALAAWEVAVAEPDWDGTAPAWIHADLLRPNLLVHRGNLHAVIDFGIAGIGDPAADVIAAWSVFGADGRQAYRSELAIGDAVWLRGMGFALHQAVGIIPYYRQTNPAFAALGKRTVEQILQDFPA